MQEVNLNVGNLEKYPDGLLRMAKMSDHDKIPAMENIDDVRYKNTRLLIEQHCDPKSQIKDFAQRLDVKASYASNIAAKKIESRVRVIGDSMARRIEAAFDMPRYWLDTPHYTLEVREEPANMALASFVFGSVGQTHVIAERRLPLIDTPEQARQYVTTGLIHSEIDFPIFPLMELSKKAFVHQEKTTLMMPSGRDFLGAPGDFYYIDPEKDPAIGDLVLCDVDGQSVVGRLEKGLKGWRLAFNDQTQPPVDIDTANILGTVQIRINGKFISDR